MGSWAFAIQYTVREDFHCGVAIKLQKLLDFVTCCSWFVKQFIVPDFEKMIFSDLFSRRMDRFDTQRPLDQPALDRRLAIPQEIRIQTMSHTVSDKGAPFSRIVRTVPTWPRPGNRMCHFETVSQ